MKEKLHLRPGAEGSAALLGPNFRRIQPHHHEELEINLVTAGRASYLFGKRRVPLPTHALLWLFPEQEHVLIDWSADFAMWVLVFRPELVARCARTGTRRILRSPDPGDVLCRQVEARQVNRLHRIFEDAAGGVSPDLDLINAALSYALVASWQAYEFSSESPLPVDVHPAVAKAARLIARADEPPTLDELARQAGLSPARLSRLFKRQAGISLTEFRQRKCLERFLGLYGQGARFTLIEAALQSGFGSYVQFHRVFCRLMRMSPAAYRKSVLLR
jgi:AraC-like DNA-binding protein